MSKVQSPKAATKKSPAKKAEPKTDSAKVAPRKRASKSTVAETVSANVAPEKIAERAYELYLTRGGQHGDDLSDWLQAEQELSSSK